MKRRGFFGFMAGAAVAGPSVAKQVAQEAVADLSGISINGMSPASGMIGNYGGGGPPLAIEPDILRLTRLLRSITGLTEDQRRKARKNVWVDRLDPDLASYRSMSIGTRVNMQRDRNLQARIDNQRSWIERQLLGESDDDIVNML